MGMRSERLGDALQNVSIGLPLCVAWTLANWWTRDQVVRSLWCEAGRMGTGTRRLRERILGMNADVPMCRVKVTVSVVIPIDLRGDVLEKHGSDE